MYGSSLTIATLRPRASRIAPSEAEAMPFPNEETTPPVTKTNRDIAKGFRRGIDGFAGYHKRRGVATFLSRPRQRQELVAALDHRTGPADVRPGVAAGVEHRAGELFEAGRIRQLRALARRSSSAARFGGGPAKASEELWPRELPPTAARSTSASASEFNSRCASAAWRALRDTARAAPCQRALISGRICERR